MVEQLKQRFRYENGKLFYKAVPFTKPYLMGREAGTIYSNGYRIVSVGRKRIPATHVIWALHHGVLPDEQIDHINHDPLDNRIENLREATRNENQRNKTLQRNNTSGYKGVKRSNTLSKPWRAYLRVAGKNVDLGCYLTKEDAALAYNDGAVRYFGQYASLNEIKRAGL